MVKRLFIPVDDVVFVELKEKKGGRTWLQVVEDGCNVQRDSTE